MSTRKVSQSDRRRTAAQAVLDRVKVLHHFGMVPEGVSARELRHIAARPDQVRAMHRHMGA